MGNMLSKRARESGASWWGLALALGCLSGPTGADVQVDGDLSRFQRVTLTFDGVYREEQGDKNPFLDVRLDVEFEHLPTGLRRVVPGFFAADGQAADSGASAGDQWRAHWRPERQGLWRWTARMRKGANIALVEGPVAGTPVTSVDGETGLLDIAPTSASLPDLASQGFLRYVDRHQLAFSGTGARYLKNGANSPENLLAYHEFDGTWDLGGLETPGLVAGLHQFLPHLGDFDPNDPVDAAHTWNGGRGGGILGAINYLASQGVNASYFLTFNIGGDTPWTAGDGQDVWPWATLPGQDPSTADRTRYDVSKLGQWERVFAHMEARGIALHVVLQEEEIDQVLDSGELGVERKLYHRELVARFGHHLAVTWNLGEENTNTDAQRIAFAEHIRALDPYDHPIAVHSIFGEAGMPGDEESFYSGLFGADAIEGSSIQGFGYDYKGHAQYLRHESAQGGRPWVITGDEQYPPVEPDSDATGPLRRAYAQNVVGGGAGCEWYFGYQGTFGDVQSEDYRQAETLWQQMHGMHAFFSEELRTWEMFPADELGGSGQSVLAKPGELYLLQLANGGSAQLDLTGHPYPFRARWYDPRSAELAGEEVHVQGGAVVDLGLPPYQVNADWMIVVDNQRIAHVGEGLPGGNGLVPGMRFESLPSTGGPQWVLEITDLKPFQQAVLVVSNELLEQPLPYGGGEMQLIPPSYLHPWAWKAVADADGVARLELPSPNAISNTQELNLQVLVYQKAVWGGVALSQALHIELD